MRDHRRLRAFQTADRLVLAVHHATRTFPVEERFALAAQMRRAALSVAANIVEGCGRGSEKQVGHFLRIAFGSLREVGYYISVAARLGYCRGKALDRLEGRYDQTARQLTGLLRAFETLRQIR